MSWGYYYPPYVSVARKRAKAERKLRALQKKNSNIQPVVIYGHAIAKTWWGKSWNTNLESYADYTNRIGRGRSYVRHGAVLDLKIKSGLIESFVSGSRSAPYKTKIKIKALKTNIWKNIKKTCQGEFASLQELLNGQFPKSLSTIFTDKKSGLFPSPKEIAFDCSCPDWADMCKHIAATLYAIGARLDSEPELFFALRGVNTKDLITTAVKTQTTTLIKKARKKSSKIMDDSDLSEIFGIDLETSPKPKRPKKPAAKQKKKPTKKTKTSTTSENTKKAQPKKKKKTVTKNKTALKKTVKKKLITPEKAFHKIF